MLSWKKVWSEEIMVNCDVICGADEKIGVVCLPPLVWKSYSYFTVCVSHCLVERKEDSPETLNLCWQQKSFSFSWSNLQNLAWEALGLFETLGNFYVNKEMELNSFATVYVHFILIIKNISKSVFLSGFSSMPVYWNFRIF